MIWSSIAPGFNTQSDAVVAVPSNASATPAGSTIPISQAGGTLASGWGGGASSLATTDANSQVVQKVAHLNTAQALATAGDVRVNADTLTFQGSVGTHVAQTTDGSQAQTGVFFTDTGAAGALVLTPTPAIAAYAAGQAWSVKIGAGNGNTSTSTINISAVGARNIFKNGAALTGGELVAGQVYDLVDDGTQIEIVGSSTYTSPSDVITDLQMRVSLNDGILTSSTTLPVMTRNALGDYSFNRTSGGAETVRYNVEAPLSRTTANKGYKLKSVVFAYTLGVADISSFDITAQSSAYVDQTAVAVTAAFGGAVEDEDYDANHNTAAKRLDFDNNGTGDQVTTLTLDTASFNNTANNLVTIEGTWVLANTCTLKIRGVWLNYSAVQN